MAEDVEHDDGVAEQSHHEQGAVEKQLEQLGLRQLLELGTEETPVFFRDAAVQNLFRVVHWNKKRTPNKTSGGLIFRIQEIKWHFLKIIDNWTKARSFYSVIG